MPATPQEQQERFDDLYGRYAPAVEAYARRRAPALADDVVAETFLVCWRKLDRVPADALPWLYAVARKTLANHRRRERRAARPLPATRATAELELPGDPTLARAWTSLRPDEREVLALVAWEGLAPADAARVLGCTAVACRVRLHRAKRRLARRLAELEPSPAFDPSPRGASQ
jgi:RNA polymerase sigma-70 factor (ECF subfamily)